MKVRLIKPKTIDGRQFNAGWVLGVDEPTGNAWIAAGEVVKVQEEARTLKLSEDVPVMLDCVETEEMKAAKAAALAEARATASKKEK